MDELEQRLFLLKIEYEKYFSGLEAVEPAREREALRRMVRDLLQGQMPNTRQAYRLNALRSRFSQMEQYWQRNLVMIERGTHPRQRFKADLHERERKGVPPAEAPVERPRALTLEEREDQAFRAVFDKYVDARRACGQSTELAFASVREVLRAQVRTIKSRYQCKSVKFRVTVEDGRAKVKAVPMS